jgi:uncharacterized protein (DUF1697 family)
VTTRVAFLRAVNVGKRKVVNARLVELFGELGYTDVWTYINSGNVVFDAPGSRAALETTIGAAIEDDVGFEVTTFVRTARELRTIRDERPFEVGPGDTHFVTFLKDRLAPAAVDELEALSNDFDTLVVRGGHVHWRMHGRSTETKVPPRDWARVAGKLRTTSRNMTMLRKLVDKISG